MAHRLNKREVAISEFYSSVGVRSWQELMDDKKLARAAQATLISHHPRNICDACEKVTEHTERDHRVAKFLGGTNDIRNLHYLCIEHHREKSKIEADLRGGDLSKFDRWYELAVPKEKTYAYVLVYWNEWLDSYKQRA